MSRESTGSIAFTSPRNKIHPIYGNSPVSVAAAAQSLGDDLSTQRYLKIDEITFRHVIREELQRWSTEGWQLHRKAQETNGLVSHHYAVASNASALSLAQPYHGGPPEQLSFQRSEGQPQVPMFPVTKDPTTMRVPPLGPALQASSQSKGHSVRFNESKIGGDAAPVGVSMGPPEQPEPDEEKSSASSSPRLEQDSSAKISQSVLVEDTTYQDHLDHLVDRLPLPPWAIDLMHWVLAVQEPERKGLLATIVRSHHFEAACMFVIVLNAVITMLSTNYEFAHRGNSKPAFDIMNLIFALLYTCELAAKLAVHGWYFFINKESWYWNVFDFLLVCNGLYDQINAIVLQDAGLNMVFLRSLRLLKMTRVLRVFRLIRAFSVLRLILSSILGSMSSLLWSLVMMVLIFFMFGLVIVQNCTIYLVEHESTLPDSAVQDIKYSFGSVENAILSLFMAATGGEDWSVFYRMLEPVGGICLFVYLFFVCFTQIALMNILTGIFVENAMKLAEPDRQALYAEIQRSRMKQRKELEAIMNAMDTQHDRKISHTQFRKELNAPKSALRAYLTTIGIHEADAERFYVLLQGCDPENETAAKPKDVDMETFVNGCIRLRGDPHSLDTQAMICELKELHKKVLQSMNKKVDANLSHGSKASGPDGRGQVVQENTSTRRALIL